MSAPFVLQVYEVLVPGDEPVFKREHPVYAPDEAAAARIAVASLHEREIGSLFRAGEDTAFDAVIGQK